MQRQALAGVKVLDFSWVVAGSATTRYLAQWGATVVKVESKWRIDPSRTVPCDKDGLPGPDRGAQTFTSDNLNKYGLALNMKNPRGIELAKRLVAWANIVTENMRPGAMERWGLGYEDLKKVNPSIIMARSCGYGQTGPRARMTAMGTTLQSLCGFTFLTGWPDRDPSPPWSQHTDVVAPMLGAAAMLAALDHQARTGQGQVLDLSQYEAGLQFLAPVLLDYAVNGRGASRMGNACTHAAPHGVYRCLGDDRWCAIAVFSDKDWKAFCKAIGRPSWRTDPRFGSLAARKAHEAELNGLIEEWTMSHTAEDVMALLQKVGVSAGVVENTADLVHDPQLRERDFFQMFDHPHPELGGVLMRGAGFRLSRTPWKLERPAPCVGEHTEYVCRELLGLSDEEFADLQSQGVLE